MSKKRLVLISLTLCIALLLFWGMFANRPIPYSLILYNESLFQIVSVKCKDGVNVFTTDTHARGRVNQIAFHNWKPPQNIRVTSKYGVIHVFFEEQTNSKLTQSTVISFEADSDPKGMKFYLNDKLVGSQNFFYGVE